MSLRDEAAAPSLARLAADLGASREDVAAALHRLADLHCLALVPGSESIWMAHPFSGIETDFRVTVGTRRWFATSVPFQATRRTQRRGDARLHAHFR